MRLCPATLSFASSGTSVPTAAAAAAMSASDCLSSNVLSAASATDSLSAADSVPRTTTLPAAIAAADAATAAVWLCRRWLSSGPVSTTSAFLWSGPHERLLLSVRDAV